MENITDEKKIDNKIIEQMFSVGAHFAYSKTRRHPSAKPFIFGAKNRVEIFDLEKTSKLLEEAKEFAKSIGMAKKQILFVSSKSEAIKAVKNGALSLNLPFVAGRWIGGTLTNFSEIQKRVARLQKLESDKEKGLLGKYTKKERLLIDREIEKLNKKFSGLTSLEGIPRVVFIVDPKKEEIAVLESVEKNISIIALANSDCNIGNINYPIVANDSSKASIEFFVNEIIKSYEEGKKLAPEKEDTEKNKAKEKVNIVK